MIAYDAKSNGSATTTSPLTWNHTCTGSDLVLICGFSVDAGSGTETVTAVTYNSVSMTQIGSALNNSTSNSNISLWYLLNPATGSNQISATLSSIFSVNGVAISLTGVSAYDTTATNASSSSPISTSIIPSTNGAWIVDLINNRSTGAGTLTPTTPQIVRVTTTNTANNVFDMCTTAGSQTPQGNSKTFSYTATGTGFDLAHRMATFSPVTFKKASVGNINIRPRAFAPGIAR